MAETDLPRIYKRERKIDSSGTIILEQELEIKGESLKSCIREFDKRWKDG